jgi:hypothetical protein
MAERQTIQEQLDSIQRQLADIRALLAPPSPPEDGAYWTAYTDGIRDMLDPPDEREPASVAPIRPDDPGPDAA